MNQIALTGLVIATLAACAPVQQSDVTTRFDTKPIALLDTRPETSEPGQCWAKLEGPKTSRTVEKFVEVTPARRDAAGTEVSPAIFRKTQDIVTTPGPTQYFERVCEAALTPAFIGALQRALIARQLLEADVSQTLDTPTQAAIQDYQTAKGLPSAILSLAVARQFGLVEVNRPDPDDAT
ncbi:MAG: peptidoglycan-binding protein [Pseudomonadota bacterium]